MALPHHKNDIANGGACSVCGRKLNLLSDYASLSLFLSDESMQRRGLQCMNCRQAICLGCSDIDQHCGCGSNAWMALPYLENSTSRHTYTHLH